MTFSASLLCITTWQIEFERLTNSTRLPLKGRPLYAVCVLLQNPKHCLASLIQYKRKNNGIKRDFAIATLKRSCLLLDEFLQNGEMSLLEQPHSLRVKNYTLIKGLLSWLWCSHKMSRPPAGLLSWKELLFRHSSITVSKECNISCTGARLGLRAVMNRERRGTASTQQSARSKKWL